MARIRIEDLPKDMEMSREEMRMILGGLVQSSVKTVSVLQQGSSSLGDDAQLANIDLQNKLQQQQQTLQTMSNVSKMLHDTAMAVVRKIG